jgi:hypothetical protein
MPTILPATAFSPYDQDAPESAVSILSQVSFPCQSGRFYSLNTAINP